MTLRLSQIPKDPYLGYDAQAVARLAAACRASRAAERGEHARLRGCGGAQVARV